jgi:hypothetical protein
MVEIAMGPADQTSSALVKAFVLRKRRNGDYLKLIMIGPTEKDAIEAALRHETA